MCRLLVIFAWMVFVLTLFEWARAAPSSTNTYMTIPDEESGDKVVQWTEEMNVNPEELGNYFQGDIMLTNDVERNGLRDEKYRWPNKVIPYVITGKFNQKQLNLIYETMRDYMNDTCLRFKQRSNERDYIMITSNNTGCWSHLGRIGGSQTVNLQIPGCVTLKGTVLHELMHAAGFLHEHVREDRDGFVRIKWNNIQQKAQSNFVKMANGTSNTFGVSYDYGSVMHYSANAFAINDKQKTIETTNPPNANIGQRKGFSKKDIKKLNAMYKCEKQG